MQRTVTGRERLTYTPGRTAHIGTHRARSGWGAVGLVAGEADAAGWGVGVDVESVTMYHDVVVEPAEGAEVGGVVVAASGPGPDVVGFEAVA